MIKTGREPIEISVYKEQIALLYKRLPYAMFANLVNSTALSVLLWPVMPHALIIAWLVSQYLITLFRMIDYRAYKVNGINNHNVVNTKQRFLIGAWAAAISWAFAAWLLFPLEDMIYQTYMIIVLIGIVAGAMISLNSLWSASLSYLVLILPILCVRLLMADTEWHIIFFFIAVLYAVYTIMGAYSGYETLLRSLQLQYSEKAMNEKLNISERRYHSIFSEAPMGIIQFDQKGNFIECNQQFLDMLEVSESSLKSFNILSEQQENIQLAHALQNTLVTGSGHFYGDYKSIFSDKVIPVRSLMNALHNDRGEVVGLVAIVEDVTERRLAEDRIKRLAYFDALTELPNRRSLQSHLDQMHSLITRGQIKGAVLFMDLDRFKVINDSLGHSIGDGLLKAVSLRLSQTVKNNKLYRLGGDEFVVVLEKDAHDKRVKVAAMDCAEAIRFSLQHAFYVQGHELHITPSIGIAYFPEDSLAPDMLLKCADMAMYKAKSLGRNRVVEYQSQMDEKAQQYLSIEKDLRYAIEHNEFNLLFQPQVDLQDNSIIGVEALLRWNHRERGLIKPEEFIPIAEDSTQIIFIGNWVFEEVCRYLSVWDKAGYKGFTMSVNISAVQFHQRDFIEFIESILSQYAIDPARIELELTESVIMEEHDFILQNFNRLKALGIQIAIDDFGTGYSNLNYLKRLPISRLKIDKSFVDCLESDENDIAIIKAIISMAGSLGLRTIAEGVESLEQLKCLQAMGCHEVQGYYFKEPLASDDLIGVCSKGFAAKVVSIDKSPLPTA